VGFTHATGSDYGLPDGSAAKTTFVTGLHPGRLRISQQAHTKVLRIK
jgi:hypothetical protein